jgi:Ni/Co efflux regulator RcnB
MKKILLTIAATAAVVAAMPAAAQSYGQGPGPNRPGYEQDRDHRNDRDNRGGYDNRGGEQYRMRSWSNGTRRGWAQARKIDQREAQIDQRIDSAVRRRAITIGEARNFQFKLNNIEQIEIAYKRHNRDLTRVEVRNLNYRLDLLSNEIRQKSRM